MNIPHIIALQWAIAEADRCAHDRSTPLAVVTYKDHKKALEEILSAIPSTRVYLDGFEMKPQSSIPPNHPIYPAG